MKKTKPTTNSELQLQTGVYHTTLIGMEILKPSTMEEWRNYGEILRRVEEAKQWVIGDWLLDGMNHFEDEHGKKKKYTGTGLYQEAERITGYAYGHLADMKRVSEIIGFTVRTVNLSYNHHKAVASIKRIETVQDKKLPQGRMQWADKEPDMDKIQEFLKQTERKGWSVSDLQEYVKKYKKDKEREFALHNTPEKYDIVYADPPWEYGDKLIEGYGAAEHHYPAMSIYELCNLSINKITADNAVLFLWVTSPLLEECFEVINTWGFTYKTSFVWDKEKHNYGHYNSVRHEFLLICTKGSYLPENNKLFDSVQTINRSTIHSQKPEEFRKIIETMYPSGRKIELFARKTAPGWDVYGNEIEE